MNRTQKFYADLAAKHGVDPTDEAAVDDFIENKIDYLPFEDRVAIIKELFRFTGEPDLNVN